MRYLLFITIIFTFISCSSQGGRQELCKQLKIECHSGSRAHSRTSSVSFPSQSSSAFSNPAALSLERGLGIETINPAGGPSQIGIVTGTGRVGAAISNNPMEETFYGNVAFETVNQTRERLVNEEFYESEKINLAFATNIFGKKAKDGIKLDLGVMAKKIPDEEEIYYGMGLSATLARVISVGFSRRRDLLHEDLRNELYSYYPVDGEDYLILADNSDFFFTRTKYYIETRTVGVKAWNLAYDYVEYRSYVEGNDNDYFSVVRINNISFFVKKWILTYGQRIEESPKEVWNGERFEVEEFKYNTFLGAQYAFNQHFLLGVFLGYYLKNDVSFGLTYFL